MHLSEEICILDPTTGLQVLDPEQNVPIPCQLQAGRDKNGQLKCKGNIVSRSKWRVFDDDVVVSGSDGLFDNLAASSSAPRGAETKTRIIASLETLATDVTRHEHVSKCGACRCLSGDGPGGQKRLSVACLGKVLGELACKTMTKKSLGAHHDDLSIFVARISTTRDGAVPDLDGAPLNLPPYAPKPWRDTLPDCTPLSASTPSSTPAKLSDLPLNALSACPERQTTHRTSYRFRVQSTPTQSMNVPGLGFRV